MIRMDQDVVIPGSALLPVVWWAYLIQGLIAILFGAIALFWTKFAVDIIAYFIGALIIISSLSLIVKGAKGKESGGHRTLIILLGLLGLVIGVLAVLNVYVLWVTIAVLIALWAFISGFGDLWIALTSHEKGTYRALCFVTGIIGVLLGFMLVLFPAVGTYAIMQVVGIFLIAMGIAAVITGFYIQGKLGSVLS